MIKREEISTVDSCFNSAADDEPLFVLRANDELAAQQVRTWAEAYQHQKCAANPTHTLTEAQLTKYRSALALADAMDRWRTAQSRQSAAPPAS